MNVRSPRSGLVALAAATAVAALGALLAAPSSAEPTTPRVFPTPKAAADALVQACEAPDAAAALLALLGPDAKEIVATADAAADATARKQVAALARQSTRVEESGASATLVLGFAAWPFPVPLAREGDGWRFDVEAGRKEVLARRVGRNELQAITVMRAFGAAQRAYASEDRDGDGVLEYAQRLQSTPGQRDGLWWASAAGGPESPFGPMVAAAGEYGAERKAGQPWFGYRFRVLRRQGANAPGGAYDYMGPKGDMLGGFALLAWPVEHRVLGVTSFLVGREGRVFQKDLGPGTEAAAQAIDAFDPDPSWTPLD
jgi:hypothetical protein